MCTPLTGKMFLSSHLPYEFNWNLRIRLAGNLRTKSAFILTDRCHASAEAGTVPRLPAPGLANSLAQFYTSGCVGLNETVEWKCIRERTAAALLFLRGRSDFVENHHPFNEE